MRSKFDEQLVELNDEMIVMGQKIVEAILLAIEALTTRNYDLAKKVIDNDKKIDRLQKRIEAICFDLLIRQQPVAKDLRTVTAAMKMVTDMERIGDHASDISEMTILMGERININQFKHIKSMASETVLMLNKCIEAFIEKNESKAEEVIKYDDVIDQLFKKAMNDVKALIMLESEDAEGPTNLLLVAKYFEKIGDHTTNIAKWIIYSLKTSE